MTFANKAARTAHRGSDAVQTFVDMLYPRCVEPCTLPDFYEAAVAKH